MSNDSDSMCSQRIYARVKSDPLSKFIFCLCVIKNNYREILGRACYVGHPICSNNGLTSQKLLLKS